MRRYKNGLGRPSPALVLAFAALMVALSGTAVGKQVVASSMALWDSADIRNNSLTGRDIKNSSLTGADVRNGSLGVNDLKAGVLGNLVGARGAKGDQGAAGTPGAPGATGPAGPGSGGKGSIIGPEAPIDLKPGDAWTTIATVETALMTEGLLISAGAVEETASGQSSASVQLRLLHNGHIHVLPSRTTLDPGDLDTGTVSFQCDFLPGAQNVQLQAQSTGGPVTIGSRSLTLTAVNDLP